ncbi:hydrophobin-251 [Armillaria luteobubalina]|uniref:Hydrophobin n=2 Tax=Physalacriaceae TaxID=862241 RepID=A0AA39NB60_ARMTA|nr:hydrophobin-251 [Desarmillaria tabescens]KAK0225277.1 hydrophobin-251 [Armillaria fumosa]KAK0462395.1 hydrophobin-251 [Desarmillaria tabescens]KAK0505404.1 hydrophobin-251 [Armillaria luteobubalina]
MFSRLTALAVLALPLFVAASPATTTTVTGGQCNTGSAQCCKSVQDPKSSAVQQALGLLNIPIGTITAGVGLTCDPITVIGLGTTQCANQPVCCEQNNYNGLVALGCTPINVGA